MKTEKNILVAFLSNLFLSIFEFVGGAVTGSIAIISDAIHDFSDCITLGIAYFLERKSHSRANDKYTYGYARYSTLGALITTVILIAGSIFIILESLERIFTNEAPELKSTEMLIFAAVGLVANLFATYLTRKKHNLNERAINLHMLEDVLGSIVILVGAVIIKFTGLYVIDSIMSLGVAIFIIVMTIKNMKPIGAVFLEKAPDNISVKQVKRELGKINCVENVHHLHLWGIDETHFYATLHVVTKNPKKAKQEIRDILGKHQISHVTIETESPGEICQDHDHHEHK